MKRTPAFITILSAFLALGAASVLLADEQCSLRSVAGDWGYTVTGVRNPVGPAASVGRLHFDRDGSITGTQTLSINGTIVQGEVLSGTLIVNSDCTGSAVVNVTNTPFPRTAHFFIVWIDSSTELRAIFTDNGLILTVDARRVNHGND